MGPEWYNVADGKVAASVTYSRYTRLARLYRKAPDAATIRGFSFGVTMEEWRDVEGYEGLYQVSSYGRVRSVDRIVKYPDGKSPRHFKGKELRPQNASTGYLFVNLSRNSRIKRVGIHRLVALSFIQKPDGNMEVNHKDGNRHNNRVENLEWVTRGENILHSYRKLGRKSAWKGRKMHNRKITDEQAREIKHSDATSTILAREYHCDPSTICNIRTGRYYREII